MRKGEGGRKEETAGSYMTSGSSSAASDLGKESLYAGQYLQRVFYGCNFDFPFLVLDGGLPITPPPSPMCLLRIFCCLAIVNASLGT